MHVNFSSALTLNHGDGSQTLLASYQNYQVSVTDRQEHIKMLYVIQPKDIYYSKGKTEP